MSSQAKQQVEYSALVSAEQAADYFESVAAGIRQHVMLVESGNDSIELDIGDTMKLDAEFHADEKKSSIEFELSWRAEAPHAMTPPSLHVLTADDLVDREEFADGLPRPFGPRGTDADALDSPDRRETSVARHDEDDRDDAATVTHHRSAAPARTATKRKPSASRTRTKAKTKSKSTRRRTTR